MLLSLWLVCLAVVCWWVLRRQSYWRRLGIPEVGCSYPLVGNLLPVLLGRRALWQVQEEIFRAARGLPYVGIYNLTIPVLLPRDPVLIETILRDETRNFEDHGLYPDPSDPLSMNLFYLKGKLWKWVRSKLRSSFSTSGVKNSYPEVQRCVNEFLEHVPVKINLKPNMDEFTCEVLAKAIFSLESNEGFVEAAHSVYDLSGFAWIRVIFRMFFPKVAIALGVKVVPQRVEDLFRNALLTSARKPGSFLDSMLKLHENEPDFNEAVLLGQFFIFILAGFETTSTALTFCLYHLAKYPEIQEKARKEVKEVIRKQGVSFESYKEMIYLDCIINESLRLYSPVTSILRVAERPYKLPCGAVLPPGTPVVIPYLYIHRDPDIYPNPMDFIPERWEGNKPAFFNPFGLGPRNCLGMQFALLEIKTFLSSLLFKYTIRMDPATIEPLEFDSNSFFMIPKNPLYVTLELNKHIF